MTLIILYGNENKRIVTKKCLNKLTEGNIMTIPAGDQARNDIFGDHVYGYTKKIFVVVNRVHSEYDYSYEIKINISDNTVNAHRVITPEESELSIYNRLNVSYGTKEIKKDVTDICLGKSHNNSIVIPCRDHERNDVFGDHIWGVTKKIFITIDNVETEHEYNNHVTINLSDYTILSKKM